MIKCDLFLMLLGHCSCLVLKEPETSLPYCLLCSQMCSGFRYHCLVREGATPSRPHFFSDVACGKGVESYLPRRFSYVNTSLLVLLLLSGAASPLSSSLHMPEHSPMAVVTVPSLLPTLQWRQPCPAESYPNLLLVDRWRWLQR